MGTFRKIIVDNSEYIWPFRYDDYDYRGIPYLLIATKAFPKVTLHINFPVKDHSLLNSDLPAVFQRQRVSIDLNQPLFVSQITRQCSKQIDFSNLTGYRYLNGLDTLKAIGYELFWQLSVHIDVKQNFIW